MNDQKPTSGRTGRVLESDGALVSLQFEPKEIPLILSRLATERESLCVVRTLPDGFVQAAAMRQDIIWTPGQEVRDLNEPFLLALPDEVAKSLIKRSNQKATLMPIGVKTIDFFAPMVQNGATGVFAEWGVGAKG